jgi:hypothetical protein
VISPFYLQVGRRVCSHALSIGAPRPFVQAEDTSAIN